MNFIKRSTSIDTSPEKIHSILTRGVEDIIVRAELESALKSGKQLRVKLGFDPTSPYIHIGRAIVLRKLKAFQDLGHKVVFIVGDFTALIGDPSDKLEKRPMLTTQKIEENLKNYKAQVAKIIDVRKAEFVYNSTWLKKLGFEEITKLAETFTVQQMLARRNFSERMEKGQEISVREFLYPLMQGYDSVAINADVELGGFDQLFNVKAGRTVQKYYGKPEQSVLTTQMLEGTDGRKMSSSWGNVIAIVDAPSDMYGKLMAVKDELITKYFLLCTDVSETEIEEMKQQMESGANPKDYKMRLAREVVKIYHSNSVAEKAEQDFINTFKKGGVPEDAITVRAKKGAELVSVVLEKGLVASKTEWKRLVDEGAVTHIDSDTKITDLKSEARAGSYKIGKRRFIKIEIE